jgi:hypothetical protein
VLAQFSGCAWCWNITGMSQTCQCKENCGANKCPAEAEGLYGYNDVPVPVFEKKAEEI